MPNFLAALKAKQGSDRDEDFARQLGISRGHWTHIQRGTRHPSATLVKRICQRWPDLVEVYLDDLRQWLFED